VDTSNFTLINSDCKDFERASLDLEVDDYNLTESGYMEDFLDEECPERGIMEFFPQKLTDFIDNIDKMPSYEVHLQEMA